MMKTFLPIVDTHAHMGDPAFDPDRDDVLAHARIPGVCTVISVGENESDARRNLDLSAVHPEIRAAAGLYPTCLDPEAAGRLTDLIRCERAKLESIGEVGLDFWAVKTADGFKKRFSAGSLIYPLRWIYLSMSTPGPPAVMQWHYCWQGAQRKCSST